VKYFLDKFDKAFENKVRLGVMSVLLVNDEVDFNSLKELLSVTDGNLASHLKALEKVEYISVRKEFQDRKPHTLYSATTAGQKAFSDHISAIEELLKQK
tara:strand:- start:20869 stop:21165 length:297 start_codon:yes stop_codon:yes gene_type:complete